MLGMQQNQTATSAHTMHDLAYVFHQDVFSVESESVVSWSRYLKFYSTAILFATAEFDTYINHSFFFLGS